jgi:hypothetical protein
MIKKVNKKFNFNKNSASLLSNSKNEQNNSLSNGLLLDDTWLNGKNSHDTSGNFEKKLKMIMNKSKTPTHKQVVHTIQLIKNPQKSNFNQKLMNSKKSSSNKDEENLENMDDTVPLSNEHINQVSSSNIKHNNLTEINNKLNFNKMNNNNNNFNQSYSNSFMGKMPSDGINLNIEEINKEKNFNSMMAQKLMMNNNNQNNNLEDDSSNFNEE